jgi:uncharacterized protein (TIGR02145 family)
MSIKKLNGILWANVKKVNGIAVASIKKINGIETRGWHIPSDTEWTTLTTYLGTNAGSKLAGSYNLWNDGALRQSDDFGDSGFNALPVGFRDFNSVFGYLGNRTYIWSSSEYDASRSWDCFVISSSTAIYSGFYFNIGGFPIRCLRSVSPSESSDDDGTIYTDDYTGNDGTKYDSVKIGNQIWINENLKETKYYDGTTIPRITDNTDWKNDTTGARCEYNNDSSNESDTYGYLYNWFAINNAKGLINEDS